MLLERHYGVCKTSVLVCIMAAVLSTRPSSARQIPSADSPLISPLSKLQLSANINPPVSSAISLALKFTLRIRPVHVQVSKMATGVSFVRCILPFSRLHTATAHTTSTGCTLLFNTQSRLLQFSVHIHSVGVYHAAVLSGDSADE